MSRHQSRAKDYVQDLLDACARIAEYNAGKTRESFLADSLVQDATIRNLEILGEASRQLRNVLPNANERFPEVPFAKMYALRNNLAHGYLTVNMDIIWNVVEIEIPRLRPLLESVLVNWPADLA
ncbi:MAG TPA: DUF86 domain-containing protein [Acidobacteriaceae bacterium]